MKKKKEVSGIAIGPMYTESITHSSALGISRVIGYSLLLMVLINWADIFLPPQFMNPTWELEMVGAIVESVPLLFFSLLFIFYGEAAQRKRFERLLVRILSQSCLLIAIGFFLLVPLATNSTVRINRQIVSQTGDIFRQQMEQVEQLEGQISQASNPEILEILKDQGVVISPEQAGSPKEQLLEVLAQTRVDIKSESDRNRLNRKRATMKSAFKWMIGATISGFTLIYLWKLTRWARFTS